MEVRVPWLPHLHPWVTIEVNVFGVTRVVQHFLEMLRSSKGRIINIGSAAWTRWRFNNPIPLILNIPQWSPNH